MARGLYLAALLCVATLWVGCTKSEPATSRAAALTPATNPADGAASAALTQVTLKVPHMVCANCAKSVRRDLEKIDGVTEIETDPDSKICSFTLTKPDVNYEAKLAEFAKTNPELADYEIQ